MAQATIDRYFRCSQPPRTASRFTFLDLPFTLRRRIYLHAGILSKSPIYLNHVPSSGSPCALEYDSAYPEQWPTEGAISARSSSLAHFLDGYLSWPQIHLNRFCQCFDEHDLGQCICNNNFPYQLLYVSKVIAEEVSTMFYSENEFSVYRTGLEGLSNLSHLPPKALTRMKSLSVSLNCYTEGFGWGNDFDPEGPGFCHAMCLASKRQRLFSNAKKHNEKSALKQWQQLCKLLGSWLQPHCLKLFLTCDVADVEIAEEFVRPLLQLPTLQECSVRLGSHYNYTEIDPSEPLTELARQTVNKMIRHSARRNFRYNDLPNEIQLRILEHTELATPFDLVWAFNTDVAVLIKSPYYESRTFHSCSSVWSSASCCQKCSPKTQACACWSGQAAFSSTCTCWRFPLSLFLVSREIRKDAEFIFYSKNHFLLQPRYWNNSEHLEIYNFLKHIPANGRRYVRRITWALSNLEKRDGYLEPDHLTYSQWQEAVSILLHDVLPWHLSLTIDPQFDLQAILYSHGSDYITLPENTGVDEAEHVWTVCKRLVKSLAENNRLENLFIHFLWPFEEHKDGIPKDRGAILEKIVLKEEYDSSARGKYDRTQFDRY
ncbi:hypothetical protein B0O99DRAFT_738715 [Bisporella sp. PMI_857]|nr:hypothetical protein B0O99DRAFT_738715 [Bisporella sp. PMI_857]